MLAVRCACAACSDGLYVLSACRGPVLMCGRLNVLAA